MGEKIKAFPHYILRDFAVVSRRDSSGDGRLGVGIAAVGHCHTYRRFVIRTFEKCDDGLGYRSLATYIESVSGLYIRIFPVQVVVETILDFFFELLFGATSQSEMYG